jgi:methionine-rich copper-binding protein CopC
MTKNISIPVLILAIAISAMAPASGLSVNGGLMEMTVAPGDELRHQIIIGVGDDDEPMEAKVGVFGCGFGLDGARINLDPEEDVSPYSARPFLTVTPESAIVKPNETATFVVTGTVPEDVGSGGRYALVNVGTPPRGEGQVGIALAAVIPVRLTIKGSDLVETGEITELSASSAEVSAIFENTGNHHFKASAEATLTDAEGEVVAKAEAPLMYTPVIPTYSWLFKMAFEAEEELAPGTYTVEVSVIHEDGTVLDTEETTFEV